MQTNLCILILISLARDREKTYFKLAGFNLSLLQGELTFSTQGSKARFTATNIKQKQVCINRYSKARLVTESEFRFKTDSYLAGRVFTNMWNYQYISRSTYELESRKTFQLF